MARIIKNTTDLEKALNTAMLFSIKKVQDRVYDVIQNFIKDYYHDYSPVEYQRTYDFFNSLTKSEIKKVSNGWRYRVSYKDGEKYKTKTQGGFRTKKEAEIAAAELEKKLHVGHDINAADQLFSDYMRNWFDIYKKGKYSLEHERNIERSVKLVEEYFPALRIKDITKDMYQRLFTI
jgi:hypothetical protein